MKRPFAATPIAVGTLSLFPLLLLAQGVPIPAPPPATGPTFGPIPPLEGSGVNLGLPNPAASPPLSTDVTVPELIVSGNFYRNAKIVSQDGNGRIVFATSQGQVECMFFEIDPIAFNLLRVKSPQEVTIGERSLIQGTPGGSTMPTIVPPESTSEPKIWGLNNDLLKDEPLEHRLGGPGDFNTIEGSWLFNAETLLHFQGNNVEGEVLDEDGISIGGYEAAWSRVEMRISSKAYTISFKDEDLTPISIEMRDSNFLVGKDQIGNQFRARRPGYIPDENQSDRLDGNTEKTPSEVAMVDVEFLRLVRCVNHPWTGDLEQGPDCGAPPQEEIEHRLKSFDGGSNPVVKEFLAEIPNRVKAIEEMRALKKIKMQNLEVMASVMFQRTVTRTNTNPISGISTTTTEVQTDHDGKEAFLREAEREWDAKINDLNTLLDCEYQRIAMRLMEAAPQMYQTKQVLPKLIEVGVSDEMLIVENVSGYPLSNLTIKVEVGHSETGDSPDDFRLFYSPCLHAGQKRYSSAYWLMKEEPGKIIPNETKEIELSPSKIRFFKVTAWAREARQNEMMVSLIPEPAENGSTSPTTLPPKFTGALQWTNTAGKSVLAEFVRMEGSSVVIRDSEGAIFTVPLAALDEASQAQARGCAERRP